MLRNEKKKKLIYAPELAIFKKNKKKNFSVPRAVNTRSQTGKKRGGWGLHNKKKKKNTGRGWGGGP